MSAADVRSPRRKGVQKVQKGRRMDHAAGLALAASRRAGNRKLQLRINFIEATDDQDPPLARLLRGGRGGSVRLKLYLTMLWMAAGPPHDITFPARAWAELLDLPEPEGNGDRRVRDAIDWLAERKFIAVERQQGRPSTVYLLQEDGSESPYVVPAKGTKDPETKKLAEEHWYVTLPPTFWTMGWIRVLSPAAIALLLVMLVLAREATGRFWISPAQARQRFGLSEDTWTKGTAELREHGLLAVSRKPVSEEFGWKRVRNRYALNLEPLQSRPAGRSKTDLTSLDKRP